MLAFVEGQASIAHVVQLSQQACYRCFRPTHFFKLQQNQFYGAGLIQTGQGGFSICRGGKRESIADLFGDECVWYVLGAGGGQMSLAATASQMGGNVRVGLEDSLFISRGKLAESNAQQVAKIRRIVEDLGSEVATPDEAREILHLKGGDRVLF